MSSQRSLIPHERIQQTILLIRGHRVILDADLAKLYGTTTKRLNEQVKRNKRRFPSDFMFRLTKEEKEDVVANCDHLKRLKYSPTRPYVFTEHGTLMAASVLNTQVATDVSIQIIRTFTYLRHLLASHQTLAKKLTTLERKYDKQFSIVFDAIRELMEPRDEGERGEIGFTSQ